MPYPVLALDLATVTGFAVGDADYPPAPTPLEKAGGASSPAYLSGSHRIAPPNTGIGQFLHRFDLWLSDQITVHAPSLVVFEAPILRDGHTAIDTARKLMCLAGHVELVCYRREVRCLEAHLQTIKKHATGNGRAGKEEVTAAAVRRFGPVADDNEADALWLLDHAISLIRKTRKPAPDPKPVAMPEKLF